MKTLKYRWVFVFTISTMTAGCLAVPNPVNPDSDICNSSDGTASANANEFSLAPRAVAKNNGVYKPHVAGAKLLKNHVLSATAHAKDEGNIDAEKKLLVTVSLNLHNEKELDQLLNDISDPNSPNYHRYLSPEEFKSRFSPTEQEVNQVKDYLNSNGMNVKGVDDNKLLMHATGSTQAINQVFNTEIHRFESTLKGHAKNYYAPAYELQVPATLPIQAVHGLENLVHARNHLKKYNALKPRLGGMAKPLIGSGPLGGFAPKDIKQAYGVTSPLTGSGQVAAVFQLDGYTLSDITAYETKYNLPNVPLQNILIDDVSGQPTGGAAEVTLDLELMIAMAPGLSKILVYEGPNSEQGILNTYNKIASDNIAKVISTSWGISEDEIGASYLKTEHKIFKQMAAQGQTIYAAAGDDGAYDNRSSISIDDPSAQPFVTGVGGTELATNSDGTYKSETIWSDSSDSTGGGGGISSVWTIPSWQKGIGSVDSQSSSTMRNTPDVSLNSNPQTGYSIFFDGRWTVFGGTSAAAPIWAGFTALVNQKRAEKQLPPLGFANPTFSKIGQKANYAAIFNDINDKSTNLHYAAVAGYDNASGWGTLRGDALLEELSVDLSPSPTPTSTPAPTASSTQPPVFTPTSAPIPPPPPISPAPPTAPYPCP